MILAPIPQAPATPLMEEGFNYPVGSALAANAPWSGSIGSALGVVSGNLMFGNLGGLTPAGNMLQIGGGGGSLTVYRNFSSNPITAAPGAAIYFSALINCTLLPTNSQFVAGLMEAGATSPNQPDDPLDLYVTTGSGGYRLSIASTGSDRATASIILMSNTTHLIVMKYAFGTVGLASLYIDPTPGNSEPASPNARTGQGDDDGGGSGASNLQIALFHSPNAAAQGSFNFDSLRIGTNWADVTPLVLPVSVTGPLNQSVCFGSPAVFSATATGIPPFNYQWRTNEVVIADATNNTYTLTSPGDADALCSYDVVANNVSGSVTSQVATLLISHAAPGVVLSPSNQIVMQGASNATFEVLVSGDPPLSYQWRTNGVSIDGATNSSYTLINPGPNDALNAFDLVVANPCGAATSSPALLLFPHGFFGCAALPGFFSGVNLIRTNQAGLLLSVWSSPEPTLPVTSWTLEGQMSEQPLNDGTGNSRYSINVIPSTSPVYYLIGETAAGPYLQPVPVQWITTGLDGNYYFYSDVLTISAAGELAFPAPPSITREPTGQIAMAGKTVTYEATASGTPPLCYQWYFNTNSLLANATNATLILYAVSTSNSGVYNVVVTNVYGSVISRLATLRVLPPPQLDIQRMPGGVQLGGAGVAGDVYWVQVATNLEPPVAWLTVATNVADANGMVFFSDTNISSGIQRFYRLLSP